MGGGGWEDIHEAIFWGIGGSGVGILGIGVPSRMGREDIPKYPHLKTINFHQSKAAHLPWSSKSFCFVCCLHFYDWAFSKVGLVRYIWK